MAGRGGGGRLIRVAMALVIAVALAIAACAPAAPSEQAEPTATFVRPTATPAPQMQPTSATSLPADPAGPPGAPPPPTPSPPTDAPRFVDPTPSILEGGDRLPNVDEIMATLGISEADARAKYVELRVELAARDDAEGRITKTQGPETAGSVISVGGRPLQLPTDVYIESRVDFSGCAAVPCGTNPSYKLRRGGVTIWIDSDGRVGVDEEIGWVRQWPSEVEAGKPEFGFLFEFLRDLLVS